MRWNMLALVAAFSVSGAAAQELKTGWSVLFQQDQTNSTTFPIAYAPEDGSGVVGSDLLLVCGLEGKPVFALQSRFNTGTDAFSVVFGSEPGVSVMFTNGETLDTGRRFVSSSSDAEVLRGLFESATAALPYQVEARGGTFPITGAKQAFALVDGHCRS
jgi:hypothetical protein